MVGRAGDRIALRSGPKRKVSAGVRAALPSSAELTARFGNSHTGVDDKVSLDGVDRTLDLMNGIRPNATTEFEVEYRWVTHAGTATLMPETRNVVYTMTE